MLNMKRAGMAVILALALLSISAATVIAGESGKINPSARNLTLQVNAAASIYADIHLGNINAAVVDFAHVLSKFLSLGMTAQEIVSRATLAPRKALNLPCTAFLKPGTPADLTIFDIEDADAVLPDSKGVPRPITRLFAPRWAILGDKLVRAGRRELPVRDIK